MGPCSEELGSTPGSPVDHLGNLGHAPCNSALAAHSLVHLAQWAAACQGSLSLCRPPLLLALFPRLSAMMVLPTGPGHIVGKQSWPQHSIREGCCEEVFGAREPCWCRCSSPVSQLRLRFAGEDRKLPEANLEVTVWSPCFQLALLFRKGVTAAQR